MYISKTSTIYRSYNYLTNLYSGRSFYPSRSLCPFIRGYMAMLIKKSFVTFILAFYFTSVIQGIFFSIVEWDVLSKDMYFVTYIYLCCMFFTLLVIGVALCFGFCALVNFLVKKGYKAYLIRKYDHYVVYTPKQPNIFWLYLKAIHEKVCPVIEFKN